MITIVANFVHRTANNSVIEGFLRSANKHYPGMKVIVGIPMFTWGISTEGIEDVLVKTFTS